MRKQLTRRELLALVRWGEQCMGQLLDENDRLRRALARKRRNRRQR